MIPGSNKNPGSEIDMIMLTKFYIRHVFLGRPAPLQTFPISKDHPWIWDHWVYKNFQSLGKFPSYLIFWNLWVHPGHVFFWNPWVHPGHECMDRCFIGMWFDFFKKPNNAIQTKSKHMIHKIYANKLKYLTSIEVVPPKGLTKCFCTLYVWTSNKIHKANCPTKISLFLNMCFPKIPNTQQNPFKQVVPQKGLTKCFWICVFQKDDLT